MAINILNIEQKHISALISLSNRGLGKGYLTEAYFNRVLNHNNYYGWVVLNEEESVVAFLIAYQTSTPEIIHKLNDDSLSSFFNQTTICLDTMVVDSKFRNKGLGKRLIQNALTYFSSPTVGFIMYAWKTKGKTNMQRIAHFFNFKQLKEYPDLWKKDCLNNLFVCPEKANNTCNCTTIIYYLHHYSKI